MSKAVCVGGLVGSLFFSSLHLWVILPVCWKWHDIPGHRTWCTSRLPARFFSSFHYFSLLLHCNSWDNSEFWHLIEALTAFLRSSFRFKVIRYISIASALTTHQSHFAKVLPFSEWSERKRSHYHFLSTKNALCSTCILLLLWKWKMRQNFVHLIDLLLLLAENLETVIFHFDLNIKFQHWILSNALK